MRRRSFPLLVVWLLLPVSAGADAIVRSQAMNASTIAEVFVEPGRVRVELEIGVVDLWAFANLLPDDLAERLLGASPPAGDRLARFFSEDFPIRTPDGAALVGRVLELRLRQRVPRDELTGEPQPLSGTEGDAVVFAAIEYSTPDHPAFLELNPPRTEASGWPANVGFVVYHAGLPVIDFRYLSAGAVVDLDWEDPWYSRFRNRNLRRQFDAPLNVFLYVEPLEVRVEVVARPVDLQRSTDLGLAGRDVIPVELQPELEARAAEFLAGQFQLEVDGESVSPQLDRVNFLSRTLRSSTVVEPREELRAVSATLGVIYVWPTLGLPQEATVSWDFFDERIARIPVAATDEAGPLPGFVEPTDRILRWQNFLQNPTLPTLAVVEPPPAYSRHAARAGAWACGLAAGGLLFVVGRGAVRGGSRPSRGLLVGTALLTVLALLASIGAHRAAVRGERAAEIVSALLHNVYRAFDYRDEEAVYDALALSASGDLLTSLYLETRRSLELASQGGARAKVKAVDLLAVESEGLSSGEGFRARCTWNVLGSVGHWGHMHQRQNQIEADLVVQPVDGHWKITELELLQEARL